MCSLNCRYCRLIPILVAFHRIAYIAETYSLILAISELNIEVICKPTSPARTRPGLFPSSFPYLLLTAVVADDVLVNSEDMERMAEELRAKISAKIRSWSGVADPTDEQEREVSGCLSAVCITVLPVLTSILSPAVQFVHLLFMEVDQDGSGSIDKGEFRMMLRKLNLTYRCAAVLTQLLVLKHLLLSVLHYTIHTVTTASTCCSAPWTASAVTAVWRRRSSLASCSPATGPRRATWTPTRQPTQRPRPPHSASWALPGLASIPITATWARPRLSAR